MRGIKDKKTRGMNLKKPKISLVLIFTIIISIFIFQGWIGPKSAEAMPLVKKGVIVKNTATGAQAVTGVGFQPKAVVFWWTRQNTFNANSAGISTGYGFAADSPTITQGSVAAAAIDNLTTTDNNFMESTTYSIVILNPGATGTPMVARASVTAFGADGFTINWQTNEAQANQIHYMALGGADITSASVGTFAGPAVAGSAAVTGVGFQPDAVLFVAGDRTGVTWDTIVAEGAQTIGFMSSATSQASIGWSARDAQTTISTGHAWSGGQAITGLRRNAIDQQAAFTSMNADGFTLNFTQTGGAANYIYLALKGGLFKMGTFNKNTAAGAQSIAGLGFQPSGLMLLSESDSLAAATVRSGVNPASNLSIGATDGTTSGSTWMHYRPLTTTDTNTFTYNTNIMKMGLNTNGTVTNYGEATFTSFDTDGFTINWTTSDATARNLIYWAIGGVLGDSVNVADGTDPANADAGRSSTNNIADSFTMVSTNTQDGLAAVTGVTASFTNSANIFGVRLYKDNGVAGTYEAGTDTLMSTGTPGASVNFTGFTENLTTTATNYLILVDIASGATLAQTIDTSVTAVTVTTPDAQGTISDASNPTRLTVIDLPHENAATALNTAIATTPILEATSGVLMQRFQVSSSTSGAGAQDNQLELNSLGIDDLGTATGSRTAKAYIDTTSSATLPGTAVLIGTLSSWTGAPTTITLNQGTAGDRTVANATSKYIYIVYDLPGGATQTVQSSITSVGVVSPDAGQTGLALNSNAITLSADPSSITSCAGCHGYGATLTDGTARNVPDGKFPGSHNKHVNTYSKACSVCHTAPASETSADFNHRNGTIQMASPINGNTGAAYVKGTSLAQTSATSPFTGCTNTYCHSSGAGVVSGTIPSNTSITWGTTATCGSCHGADASGRPAYANNTPKKNSHQGTTHLGNSCDKCHYSTTTTGTTITSATIHTDGAYNVNPNTGAGVGFTYTYNAGGGSCATVSCHGNAQWGVTQFDCVSCHSAAMGPRRVIAGASGEFGLAWGHKKTGQGAVTKYDCIVCHMEGEKATGSPSATYHANGTIELRDPDTGLTIKSVTFGGAGAGAYTSTGTDLSFTSFSRDLSVGLEADPNWLVLGAIMTNHCLKCHDYGGAAHADAQVPTTGTNLKPFGTTVASTNAANQFTYIAAGDIQGAVVDVNSQLLSTNASYHPVTGRQNNSFADIDRMKAPYNTVTKTLSTNTGWGPLISCWDCHAPTGATGTLTSTVTAHGNAVTLRRTYWAAATVATPNLCTTCHNDLYFGNGTAQTANHGANSAFATGGDGSRYTIGQCYQCHGSFNNLRPFYGVDAHGFDRWASIRTNETTTPVNSLFSGPTVASGHRPYGFLRSSNMHEYSPNTVPAPDNGTTWVSAGPSKPGCNTPSAGTCNRATHGAFTPGGVY